MTAHQAGPSDHGGGEFLPELCEQLGIRGRVMGAQVVNGLGEAIAQEVGPQAIDDRLAEKLALLMLADLADEFRNLVFIANVGEEGEGNLSGMRYLCRQSTSGSRIQSFLILDGPNIDHVTSQALALFPGVSRSGITITTGLFRGMTREAAARFSFLLSTPLIAGAAAKEVPKLLKLHHAGALDIPQSTLIASIAVSTVVGFIVIAFFLKYLQTRTLKIFIYYRIAFGIVILLLAFLHLGFAR